MGDLIAALRRDRDERFAALEGITTKATDERRSTLSAGESKSFEALKVEIDELDERIAAETNREQRRHVAGLAALRTEGRTKPMARGMTYNPDEERRGISFLRDVVASQLRGDPGARTRLETHTREMLDGPYAEFRDVGTGAFAGLVVPEYLTDVAAPLARAGRPLADICNAHPLPSSGMTVNISRITTGTAAAAQATENAAVQETDADDTLLTVNVRTIAGMQDVSRQAVERGDGVDGLIVADLARAYNTELDRQIIHADGTSGTHLGMLSTTGNVDVTYTDATPTAAELYPKLWDAIQQVQSAAFMGVTHLVMHPRRWAWMAKEVGTSFPFLQLADTPQGAAGQVLGTGYGSGLAGVLATIGVVLDANISTTLGAGTEDAILVVTAPELHLWEDANAPLLIRAEDALAGNLTVRLVVYGYSAFTAGRYPASQANITGTGLIAPTF